MRKTTSLAILAVFITIAASGCYRTRYVNFEPPPDGERPVRETTEVKGAEITTKNGWQHFFVWGWAPNKRTFPLDEICGEPQWIESVETQRTFLQGLVTSFAGFYVNIYSPYNAEMKCGVLETAQPSAEDQ